MKSTTLLAACAGLAMAPAALAQCDIAPLIAADASPGDQAGAAVAINGDYAVVGAPLESNAGGTNAGAVYIYQRVLLFWVQRAKITASDGAAGDHFGASVAFDGQTVLVGAPLKDVAGSNSGAAYVFAGSNSTWNQRARLRRCLV